MNEKSGTPFTTLQEIGFDSLMDRIRSRDSKSASHLDRQSGGRIQRFSRQDASNNLVIAQSNFADSIHFDLSYTPLPHLGSKWITATVSRLLAVGVEPSTLLVTFSIPNMISVEMLDTILEGMDKHPTQVPVEVTEVNPARNHLSASIVCFGFEPDEENDRRGNVVAGDALCVTGDVGGAMAGLRILLREKRYWEPGKEESFSPDLTGYEHVVGKQLLPACRLDFIETLQKSDVSVGAMIDLSQGLMNDLQLMAADHACGFQLFSPALPIDLSTRQVADEMKEDVDRYALYGGEDYEFLFTIPDQKVEKLRESFEDFTVVGEVTNKQNEIVVNDGESGSV